jgi:hypothetical protein
MNAMIQLVLTYSIVILTSIYVVYKLIRMLFPGKQEIIGCGSGCGCDAVKLKKEILEIKNSKSTR